MPKEVFLDIMQTSRFEGEYAHYAAYEGFIVGWQAGTAFVDVIPVQRWRDPATGTIHEERGGRVGLSLQDVDRLRRLMKKASGQVAPDNSLSGGYAWGPPGSYWGECRTCGSGEGFHLSGCDRPAPVHPQ